MRHQISSYVLALIWAPLGAALACGSSGAESPSALQQMSSNELAPCPNPDSGAAPDTSVVPDTGSDQGSPTIDFTFVADGSPTVIHATTTTEPFGEITIGNYPTTATTTLGYGSLPVGFEDAFSTTFCSSVRTKALNAKGTSTLAKLNKQLVRQGGGVPVHVVVSPFVGNDFTSQASAAATKAGAPGSAFMIDNELALSDVQLHIVLDADAMSNIIGETDPLVAAQATYLSQNLATVLSTGEFSTAFAAKDLLCDFATGKARITLTVAGTASGAPYSGQTTATLLQPL